MKMKIYFLVLWAAALSAGVTCYGKSWWDQGRTGSERDEGNWGRRSSGSRNYVDLQDFVEKYVRDDLCRKLGDFSEKWGFVDVKLSDAKSELEPDFVGHIEKVTCRVTLVPKKGVRHYIPVEWTIDGVDKEKEREFTRLLGGYLNEEGPVTNVLSKAWITTTHERRDAVSNAICRWKKYNVVKSPIGVPVQDFTGMFIARVYRAKDGEGVYRPVKKSGIQSDMIRYDFDSKNCSVGWQGSELKCYFTGGRNPENPFGDSIMTGERLKELGGVPSTNADAVRAAQAAFSMHTANFIEAFTNLVAAAKEYESVVGDERGSYFVRNRLEELRRQRKYPAQERAERAIGKARKRLSEAQRSLKQSEYAVRRAIGERDYVSRNLAKAEERHRRSVADVEMERAKLADERRSHAETSMVIKNGRTVKRTVRRVELAEAHEKSCQARVDALRQKIESCENTISTSQQNVEAAKAECAAAEAGLKQTEAEQTARVKAVSEEIEKEAVAAQQAEKIRLESVIKAAAEKLDNAWQALALPSRSDLS